MEKISSSTVENLFLYSDAGFDDVVTLRWLSYLHFTNFRKSVDFELNIFFESLKLDYKVSLISKQGIHLDSVLINFSF